MSPLVALASQRSAEIRTARSAVKRALRDGTLTLSEAMEHPDAQELRISTLLEQVSHLSPSKVSALLLYAGIGYARTVANITFHQRVRLISQIRRRHPRVSL
jgi:hypothetical protein